MILILNFNSNVLETMSARELYLPSVNSLEVVSNLPPRYEKIYDLTINSNGLKYEVHSLQQRYYACHEKLRNKCNQLKSYKSDMADLIKRMIKFENALKEKSNHFDKLQQIIKVHSLHMRQEQSKQAQLIYTINKKDKILEFTKGYFNDEVERLQSYNSQLKTKLATTASSAKLMSSHSNIITSTLESNQCDIKKALINAGGDQTSSQLIQNTSLLQKRA